MIQHQERVRRLLNEISLYGLDVFRSNYAQATFERGNTGFSVYANPSNYPHDDAWAKTVKHMTKGSAKQKCAYVGDVSFVFDSEDVVIGLLLSTTAYHLKDHGNITGLHKERAITNRDVDIAWCRERVVWLMSRAGIEPPFNIDIAYR